MRKLSADCLAALATAFLAAPAVAVPITYNIQGNCLGTCGNAGLSNGSLALGRITINRSQIVIGGTFDETDLGAYSLTFGSNTISNTNAVGASLTGVWGNDLDTIAALDLRTSTAVAPGTGLGLQLMLGGSIISTNANCPTAACDTLSFGSLATLTGVTLRVVPGPIEPSPVPLPPALGLALAGWGSLALLRRRRSRG
ncbi:MAG: hypothetical protein U1E59_03735 [Amaricoccus sp.]